MGKSKQNKTKKFDRRVEISAPYLDPEIIKAIHTPPKGQRLDIKHGGFKALLSDLNSRDSTDDLMPLNDNHTPSYIGISCAVSGYSNYSSYNRKFADQDQTSKTTHEPAPTTCNRSQTASPLAQRNDHQIHHIKIDRSNIQSADEELKELTEKLTASATERRRSPSPCIPPLEDDRHHGAYVGARYCPLPLPSKEVNKHIPLLGIDDEQNPEEFVEEENKVEQKIASLYGSEFVEDWRESMMHKTRKDLTSESLPAELQQNTLKNPKDLVTLKPAPPAVSKTEGSGAQPEAEIPTPNVKVLANVEKQFLQKLLSDDNPPSPSHSPQPMTKSSAPSEIPTETISPLEKAESTTSPTSNVVADDDLAPVDQQQSQSPMSPDSGKNQSLLDYEIAIPSLHDDEKHIEYEIRAQSPLDNESSPVRHLPDKVSVTNNSDPGEEKLLVSFSPEPFLNNESRSQNQASALVDQEGQAEKSPAPEVEMNLHDGHYYLGILSQEKSFILEQIELAEAILNEQESELDEDTVGKIRCAIGKANLLINKKFNQFIELCESNVNKKANEEFATLNEDLAGFWDMLNIQVSDIRKSFEALWQAKQENWRSNERERQEPVGGQQEDDDERDRPSIKTGSKPKLSAQKDQERREKLLDHINQMKQIHAARSSSEDLLFVSGVHDDQEVVTTDPLPNQTIPSDVEPSLDEQEEQLFSLMGELTQNEDPTTQLSNDLVDLTD